MECEGGKNHQQTGFCPRTDKNAKNFFLFFVAHVILMMNLMILLGSHFLRNKCSEDYIFHRKTVYFSKKFMQNSSTSN